MRRLVLDQDEFRTASDLARLPLLEREQVQRDPEYYVSELWPPHACLRTQTRGTTGTPVPVFRDPPSLFAEAAHRERQRRLILRLTERLGYREALIAWPAGPIEQKVKAFIRCGGCR